MTDSPFRRTEVLDAIRLLQEHGVTAEQYGTAQIAEWWTVSGREYPTRDAAFAAAKVEANETGNWAEVWYEYGLSPRTGDEYVESWIVKPDGDRP